MSTLGSKVVLITGATDGLGKRVAHDLAMRGVTILLHGRDQEKGETVLREIEESTGHHGLTYYNADFSSLDAVRRLADRIQADHERLDVLINNAGIGTGRRRSPREVSADGYELRFAVNYLAPFLLTYRLLPLLRRSAPARIINVSSAGQAPIDFDDVMLERGYNGRRAYGQSKLAQVMFTFDLAEELAGSGITINCLHPATLMNTKMVRESDHFGSPMTTVEEGAEAVEYLALSSKLEGVTGEYFEGKQPARADPEARRRLHVLSEQWAGLKESGERTESLSTGEWQH